MERRDGPRFSFRGFGPPPGREGWFPHGYRGGVCGGSFGRKDAFVALVATFKGELTRDSQIVIVQIREPKRILEAFEEELK
jgi:hypothetical protein